MAAVRRNSFTSILFGGAYSPIYTRVEVAKNLLDANIPYIKEKDANYRDFVIMLMPHFKEAVIKAMSFEGTGFDMSNEEVDLYRDYSDWVVGNYELCIKTEYEKYRAFRAIDSFIVQEVLNRPCTSLETLYTRSTNLLREEDDKYGSM